MSLQLFIIQIPLSQQLLELIFPVLFIILFFFFSTLPSGRGRKKTNISHLFFLSTILFFISNIFFSISQTVPVKKKKTKKTLLSFHSEKSFMWSSELTSHVKKV